MDDSEIGFYNTNGVYSVYTGADLARYNASKDREMMEKVFPGMYDWINNDNSSSENIFNNSISIAKIGSFGEATRSYLHGVSTAIVQDYTYGLAPEATMFSTDVMNHPEAYYKGKNMGHNLTTVASLLEGGIGASTTVGGTETVVLSVAGTVVVAHASTVLVSSQANRLKDQIMFANSQERSKTVKNSAGQEVERKLVNNQDELLEEAEKAAGGSLDNFDNYKPSWWKKGNKKIEWEPGGHSNTNEGPHVTVRELTPDGRWKVIEKIFIKGQETYKK